MDFVQSLSSIWMDLLGAAAIRILLLAVVAGVLAWVLRRRGAELRHAIWTVLLIAMLGMPLLPSILPPLPVVPVAWLRGRPAPVRDPLIPVQTRTVMTVTASGATFVEQNAAPARLPRLPLWPQYLLPVYLLCAGAALLRVVQAVRQAGGLVRRATTVQDEELREVMRTLCLQQGSGYPLPRVAESAQAVVPFTAGWQQPVILLPADWRAWDEFKLRAVLAHEMAHVKRGDWLIAMLGAVNRALFWFHPLAWWLERHLAKLAEESCDAAGIAGTGDARRYAGVVLEFAATMAAAGSRLSWAATAMARSSRVGGRIEKILEGSMNWQKRTSKAVWVSLLVLALPAMYAAAALQPERPAPVLPRTFPAQDSTTIVPGGDLTAAEAAALEVRVARDGGDVEARQLLTGYYFRHASANQYAEQLLWLVENAPASEAHDAYHMAPGRTSALLLDKDTVERLGEMWRSQAAAHPEDPAVLTHAGRFFRESNPDAYLDLCLRARAAGPATTWGIADLVRMYWVAVTGPDGKPSMQEEQRAWKQRVRAAVEGSSDADLLGLAALSIGRPKFKPQGDMPAGFWERVEASTNRVNAQARALLERAHSLAPADERWPNALARMDEGLSPMVRSAGRELPISKVAAEYPALAKSARIEGDVQLRLAVNVDGRVGDVEVVSGHPLLRQAAVAAVKQWRFAPRLEEQKVLALVPFTLRSGTVTGAISGPPEAQLGASVTMPSRIKVDRVVQNSLLVESPKPDYPQLAVQAGISGTVRFSIVIDKEGKVMNITLVAGHPVLVQAAVGALKKYRYRPTQLNGTPVEVATQVDVPFTLSQ